MFHLYCSCLYSEDEKFQSLKTSNYKLHIFESSSKFKFILLTDPLQYNLIDELKLIYQGPFVDNVIRNPLIKPNQSVISNFSFNNKVENLLKSIK